MNSYLTPRSSQKPGPASGLPANQEGQREGPTSVVAGQLPDLGAKQQSSSAAAVEGGARYPTAQARGGRWGCGLDAQAKIEKRRRIRKGEEQKREKSPQNKAGVRGGTDWFRAERKGQRKSRVERKERGGAQTAPQVLPPEG